MIPKPYGGSRDSVLVREVQVLTVKYRQTYDRIRPHSLLGYRPPAPAF